MLPTRSIQQLGLALLAGSCCLAAVAEERATTSVTDMLTQGKGSLNFRYRFEHVDQENKDKTAAASTLRSRLTFASAAYKGFSFLTEFDNVSYIGDDNFNSTTNGKTEYPVVADPKGTDFNQGWIKYAFNEASGTYGRQRINHGNQRFIGGVAWRQNEQTFDGFRALYQPGDFKLDYAYTYRVNRIFGPDDGAQPAEWRGANHFLRLDYAFNDNHKIHGFYYGLDINERADYSPNLTVNNSSDTYGLEYAGNIGLLGLRAAYATQSDAGDSKLDYDTDYYLLEGALNFKPVKVMLNYEVLASDNGVGFKTPLATLHKFQGWADLFLVTPGDGIEDLNLSVHGKAGPVKLGAIYHTFKAEASDADFGTELDLVATWPINKLWSVQAKYANFMTDDSSRFPDTERAWLTVNLKL